MKWKLSPAGDFQEAQRADWDAVNQRAGGHLLLDSGFVAPLIRHFGNPELMLGVSRDGNGGVALLHPAKKGSWQTFQPSQAPIGLIALAGGDEAPAQARALMSSLPMSALALSVMQQDPEHTAFVDLERFGEVEAQDYIETPTLTVEGSFEDFWATRHKNLTHNLNRRTRRMAEAGIELELLTDRDPGRVEECMQEYGRMEQEGWKGRNGTAVTADNPQGKFYRELLESFCERGEAVIYRLRMDGKTIASDLCIERSGVMVILKTAYDEQLKKQSPGMFLHYEIFKALFSENRIRTVEFYGRVLDWHRRWTEQVRTLFHVTLYRNRAVRLMHRLAR